MRTSRWQAPRAVALNPPRTTCSEWARRRNVYKRRNRIEMHREPENGCDWNGILSAYLRPSLRVLLHPSTQERNFRREKSKQANKETFHAINKHRRAPRTWSIKFNYLGRREKRRRGNAESEEDLFSYLFNAWNHFFILASKVISGPLPEHIMLHIT